MITHTLSYKTHATVKSVIRVEGNKDLWCKIYGLLFFVLVRFCAYLCKTNNHNKTVFVIITCKFGQNYWELSYDERVTLSANVLWLSVQVKKLKTQLEQKNGTENTSSPDGEIHENGTDQNIIELQSKNLHAWKHSRGNLSWLYSTATQGCLLNLSRRFKQANKWFEVQAGEGGARGHCTGTKREPRRTGSRRARQCDWFSFHYSSLFSVSR